MTADKAPSVKLPGVLGFRARNHPQQLTAWGVDPKRDHRVTEPELFDRLHERFRFTVGAAATAETTRLERYFPDGQNADWTGERVWCNPPYSDIRPWVQQAWAYSDDAELIVMLLPANRTEQRWWQDLIEPHRDSGGLIRTEFLPGRVRFLRPGETEIGPNQRPPFGCVLVIWGECECYQ